MEQRSIMLKGGSPEANVFDAEIFVIFTDGVQVYVEVQKRR